MTTSYRVNFIGGYPLDNLTTLKLSTMLENIGSFALLKDYARYNGRQNGNGASKLSVNGASKLSVNGAVFKLKRGGRVLVSYPTTSGGKSAINLYGFGKSLIVSLVNPDDIDVGHVRRMFRKQLGA